MGIGYQNTDRKAFDYDLWFPPGKPGLALRGPRADLDAEDPICFIGAAQTFGRFVDRPFATQVAEFLERPVLNLGFSGAGPEFYLKNDFLMSCLRRAGILVMQSMSARSVTAGVFETQRNNGVLKFTEGPRKGETHMALQAYGHLRKDYGEEAFQAQVAAVQAQWLALHRQMAGEVSGRKVFLWLSAAAPGDNVDLSKSPLGAFPHLVTAGMVDEVAAMGFEVVDCTLKDMSSQILVNDTTGVVEEVFDRASFPGRPDMLRAINNYYATPDLHDLAARKLIRALL